MRNLFSCFKYYKNSKVIQLLHKFQKAIYTIFMTGKKHIWGLGFAGLCSGLISFSLSYLSHVSVPGYIPGIIFGITIWLYIFSLADHKKNEILSIIPFSLSSAASCFVAYFVTTQSMFFMGIIVGGVLRLIGFSGGGLPWINMFVITFVSLLIGGGIGTFSLLTLKTFVSPLPAKYMRIIIIIGALLGTTYLLKIPGVEKLFPQEFSGKPWGYSNLLVLLVCWQTGIGAALGWLLSKHGKVKVVSSSGKVIFFGVIFFAILLCIAFALYFLLPFLFWITGIPFVDNYRAGW